MRGNTATGWTTRCETDHKEVHAWCVVQCMTAWFTPHTHTHTHTQHRVVGGRLPTVCCRRLGVRNGSRNSTVVHGVVLDLLCGTGHRAPVRCLHGSCACNGAARQDGQRCRVSSLKRPCERKAAPHDLVRCVHVRACAGSLCVALSITAV